ncbi:MAG: peptide deformylase [Bacteroidota bacterium]
MILKIVSYGHPSLRRENKEIGPDYPGLQELIANMYETMYEAQGIGLAAPQINVPIRMFVVDGSPAEGAYEEEVMEGFKKVFINPQIIEETGDSWTFEEGCLSIPDIRENVNRQGVVTITYLDENFQEQTETFDGMRARIVQHEYDHLEGVLFTDYISPLRKRILKRRLNKISYGDVEVPYEMRFLEK